MSGLLPLKRFAAAIDGSVALNRLLAALSDPKRSARTVAIALAAYCVLWTIYAVISKSSQDIHFDMGEMVSWSRELALGTPKHPPLPSWLIAAWFGVFPLQTWAYYLFSMVMATLVLVDRLDDRRALSRRREAGGGPRASDTGSLLQLSRTQVQREFGDDAGLGAHHMVLPALVREPQRRMGDPRGSRRRRRHAGEILVRRPVGRPCHRGHRRSAPHGVFPLAGALYHRRCGRGRAGAAHLVALHQRLRCVRLCARSRIRPRCPKR